MRGETAKKFARRQSHIAHASHALRSPGKPRLISSLLKQRQFKIPVATMAPGYKTTDPSYDEGQTRIARGAHQVLLDEGAGGPAAKASCMEWLKTDTVEDKVAVEAADWLRITLHGATFDSSCDDLPYFGKQPGLQGTARLWGVLQAGGLTFGDKMTFAQLLKKVEAIAATLPSDALAILASEMVDVEPDTPPAPAAPAAQGAGGQAGGGAALAAAPPLAAASPPTSNIEKIAGVMTYYDVYGPTRQGRHVGNLEAALGMRMLAAHRVPGNHFALAWRAIARAAVAKAGINEDADEWALAEAVGRKLRAADLPLKYASLPSRLLQRRTSLVATITSGGLELAGSAREMLPAALASGIIPRTARLLGPAHQPAALISAACDVLGLLDNTSSDMCLNSLEGALASHEDAIKNAGSAEARIALIRADLDARKVAESSAPKTDVEGKLPTHSKVQLANLYNVYSTTNFTEQEEAIERMADVHGYMYLALTASFMVATIGAPAGPRDAAELERAKKWVPIPIFHQVVWGKVESLASKPHLDKLAAGRDKLPTLAGALAAKSLAAVDPAGVERLAGLSLDSLVKKLGEPTWRSLSVIDDLMVPLMRAFHDVPVDSPTALLPAASVHIDYIHLFWARDPLTAVLRLVGVPKEGKGSVRAWLNPIQQLLWLHGPGSDPAQTAEMAAAVQRYVTESLAEYARGYNRARLSGDSHATFEGVELGGGNPLTLLNSTLRGLNGEASRKRRADGLVKAAVRVPCISWVDPGSVLAPAASGLASIVPLGAVSSVSFVSLQGGPSTTNKVPGGWSPPPSVASGLTSVSQRTPFPQGQPIGTIAGGDRKYDGDAAKRFLNDNGLGHLCVHALCCGGVPKKNGKREAAEKRTCPLWGKPGHFLDGALHVMPAGAAYPAFLPSNYQK